MVYINITVDESNIHVKQDTSHLQNILLCIIYLKKLLVKIFTRFATNITRTRYAALIKENVTTQAKTNALVL